MTVLSQLERDLHAAAQRQLSSAGATASPRSRPARRPRLRRRALAAGPIAVSALVALAIAAVALGLFGRARRPIHPAAQSPVQARSGLLAALGVLRQPQVAAERDPALIADTLQMLSPPYGRAHLSAALQAQRRQILARWGDPMPDQRLLRVVAVPSLRAYALIAPMRYRPSLASPRRALGVTLAVDGVGSGLSATGPRPASLKALRAHGLLLGFGAGFTAQPAVALVPDGVATVRLADFVLDPNSIPHLIDPRALAGALATLRATGSVNHNLAAFRLALPAVTTTRGLAHFVTRDKRALLGVPVTAHATWLNTDGRVIRRTTTTTDVLVQVLDRG